MAKNKNKKIIGKSPVSTNLEKIKQVRASVQNKDNLESIYAYHPVWRLQHLDLEHSKWGWKKITGKDFDDILEKLRKYETMTWGAIYNDKKRDHDVDINKLIKEAKKRLEELGLDDTDHLLRLRLEGRKRIWGIRDRYIFKILWWDPEHTVCISKKKHT